jgi:hypothetical protein
MQNDEYYDAFVKAWNEMLRGQNTVTEQDKEELHELMQKQKGENTDEHSKGGN